MLWSQGAQHLQCAHTRRAAPAMCVCMRPTPGPRPPNTAPRPRIPAPKHCPKEPRYTACARQAGLTVSVHDALGVHVAQAHHNLRKDRLLNRPQSNCACAPRVAATTGASLLLLALGTAAAGAAATALGTSIAALAPAAVLPAFALAAAAGRCGMSPGMGGAARSCCICNPAGLLQRSIAVRKPHIQRDTCGHKYGQPSAWQHSSAANGHVMTGP